MSAPSTGPRTFDFEAHAADAARAAADQAADDQAAADRAAADQAAADQAAAEAQAGGEQAQWTTIYPDVERFVSEVFAPTFVRRTTPTFRWCAQWWRHPEAIMRMEALWRTWEVARRDPQAGMATWLREHADHHLPILTGADGPFAECEPREHFDSKPGELPTAPAPQGWWPPQDQAQPEEPEEEPAAEKRDEERDKDQPEEEPGAEQDEAQEDWQVGVDEEQQPSASSTDRSPDHHSMEA